MTFRINSRFVWRCSFILTIAFLSLAAPAPANAQSDCTGVPATTIGGVTWTPVFCDEFNGMAGSAPNALIWTYDTGNSGFGNNEIETYCAPGSNTAPCSSSSPNIALDGSGHLLIQAILSGGQWTSGRMKTQGLKDFQYGWLEARIQLPDTTNQGLWPAFWSLGSNIATTPWPACGEADILEVWSPQVHSGPGPAGNRSTIHTASTGGSGLQPNGQYTFPSGQANNTALHAYGVIWSANMMQYYVDNPTTPFYVTTASDLSASDTWPFNAKHRNATCSGPVGTVLPVISVEHLAGSICVTGGNDERPAIEPGAEPMGNTAGCEHRGPFVDPVAFRRYADRSSSEILHLPAMINVPHVGWRKGPRELAATV